MSYFFSPSTTSFYHTLVHPSMPEDVVAITDNEWETLVNARQNGDEVYLDENDGIVKSRAFVPVMTMTKLRFIRNKKLVASDWTQGSDIPAQLKADYATYRQELRDLPETYTDPTTVVWPTPPA